MRHGRLRALVISYGLLGLCVALVTLWTNLRTDLSFVFPRQSTPNIELLTDRLQRGPALGLVLVALSGAEPEELIRLSNGLAEAFAESSRFRFVSNGRIGPSGPDLSSLFAKRYLMNPPIGPSDFGVAALRDALEEALISLSTTPSMAIKRLLPRDPTGRLRKIATFWEGGSGLGQQSGVWLSSDETAALMMVQSSAPAFDLAAQEELLGFMRDLFDRLKTNDGVRMDLAGPSVIATASSQMIRVEMHGLTLASVLCVIAIFYAAFRSPSLLLVVILPLGFGVCAGAVIVQGLHGHLHGVTLAFGSILIGIAIDYPIHLISHTVETGGARDALGSIWRTLRLGMLTTVAAFLPITLSSFPGLSQLGTFTIVGLLVAALVTRWLLPAILPAMPMAPPSTIWDRLRPTNAATRGLRLALLILSLTALVYITTRDGTIWETDLRNLSPTPAAMRALDRRLRAEMGAADVRHLLVLRQPSMEEVLRGSEALTADLQALVEAGRIAGFDMASRYLPSLHSQRQRRRDLPERSVLQANLDRAAAGLPFRSGLFEPFLDGVEQSKLGPPLTLDDFVEAGLGWRLRPLLFRQGGDWVGLIAPIDVSDPQTLADLAQARNDPALAYLDLKLESETLVDDYRRETLVWLAVGVPIAMAILWIGLRSFARMIWVAAPVGMSLLLTLAVLMLFGISLSIFHLLSLLLVVGVGLDYALFFERYARDPVSRTRTLRANVFCAATSVSVFTILAFSQIPVLHGIGTTVAVGAAFSLLLAFVFSEGGGGAER